jgi:hypothetical protein
MPLELSAHHLVGKDRGVAGHWAGAPPKQRSELSGSR